MARSKAKKWFGVIHLWVGLTTGLLVFLISITGATYVFRDELYTLIHSDAIYNNVTVKQPVRPITELWDAVAKRMGPSIKIEHPIAYTQPNMNWEFHAAEYDDSAVTYFNWIKYDYVIYINPYTAKITGVIDHKYEFFQLIKMFHWSLFLHTDYGQPIVGVGVLLFVVSLITGLVIWWPQKWKQFKEHMKVRWKARWRRINYDLHRTSAVLVLPLALIIAITGLVWAFEWVQAAVYVAAAQSITPPDRPDPKSVYDTTFTWQTEADWVNNTTTKLLAEYPNAYAISVHPAPEKDTTATFDAYIRPNGMVYYNTVAKNYDRYSGKLLRMSDFSKLNNGEKLIYMNYDIHVGQVLGIPGKILAFIASLVCASLPLSGFLIWWGRRRESRRKERESIT